MKGINIILLFAAICLGPVASGQNIVSKSDKPVTIKGRVLDADGRPVEGAVFYIDNIRTNYRSKYNGSFKIKVSPSSLKLKAGLPQYGYSETLIEGRTEIIFTLDNEGSSQYNDMASDDQGNATNIGYGTVDQENLTTSVSTVDGDNERFSSFTDIYQMIRVTVTGVQVKGKEITIRGNNSFSLSNQPLFVVDGIIVSSIDNIDPSRVSSIEVLKDASAAIYGSRAANGVILIHMKDASGKRK